jgi:hypothetical protein
VYVPQSVRIPRFTRVESFSVIDKLHDELFPRLLDIERYRGTPAVFQAVVHRLLEDKEQVLAVFHAEPDSFQRFEVLGPEAYITGVQCLLERIAEPRDQVEKRISSWIHQPNDVAHAVDESKEIRKGLIQPEPAGRSDPEKSRFRDSESGFPVYAQPEYLD